MLQEDPPSSVVDVVFQLGDSETSIEFRDEGVTTNCPVAKVGDRLHRLEGVPIAESAAFKDVIEAEDLGDGKLRFVRVAQYSNWKTFDYLFPRGWLDGSRGVSLLRELDQKGLHWERMFGGMLFICVPPGSVVDPGALVDAASCGKHRHQQ
jgi:hypothetical protein